ncbi:MAG: cobaltochelatase subunit CobN, partial [Thermoguttaceae bacterium]|nr:cobaltochelatase subunit CobN [Thermoguttaceae bacterium]
MTCILLAVGCAPKDAGKDAPAPNANQTERQAADQVPSNAFRIAFVGWFDSEAVLWRETLEGSNIEFESFKKEDFLTAPLDGFDVVLFRVMGWTPSDAEHARLHELQQTKKTVGYPQTLDFAVEATNVEPEFAENVRRYFLFPCEENVYSAASALVAAFGGEKASEVIYADPAKQAKFTAGEPVEPPEYGYFYRDARVCGSLEEFDAYRAQKGIAFPEDAPRVAMFGSFLEPFKELDHAPQDELIAKFAERGVNVYPIYNLAAKPELLTDCKPDLAIYFPRGRVLPNDEAVKLFADLNIPVLTAVLLSTSEHEWRNEPIGMTGSYYSLATALPELDGVIEPIAIGTKEENPDGLVVRAPLSERIDALVERASGWLELRRKPNAEKKA